MVRHWAIAFNIRIRPPPPPGWGLTFSSYPWRLGVRILNAIAHCLWKMCATPGACIKETGLFSSAVVVPQSKSAELCSSAVVVPQSKSTELRSLAAVGPHKVNLPSFVVARRPLCHKVNLPSFVIARWRLCHKVTWSTEFMTCENHHDLWYFSHEHSDFSSVIYSEKNI